MTEVDQASFGEVLRRFERWRTIAALLGQKPYDEPDFENGRLYFRVDYAAQVAQWPPAREQGDWGAYIIELAPTGLYNVIRSLWHERAPERTERIEAVFTQPEDAGKYVLAQIADGLHVGLRLKSQFLKWEEQGLDSVISITPLSGSILQYFIEITPGMTLDNAHEYYFDKYALRGNLEVYAVTSSENRPYMQVLVRSFDELDAELVDGLPLAGVPPLRAA